MNTTRKIQIGVMGSMADLAYSKQTERLAEQVGFWIAKSKATLVFGAEKDADSLSTAACRGAKKANGLTVGVTYGKGLEVYEKNVDVIIASGLERGGGRELTLALSCDAIICLNGGSGTLTEIAIAYQANIPVVVLKGTGGWSEKLANTYLDDRKRIKIETASKAREAVEKAITLATVPKVNLRNAVFLAGVHGDETIGIEALSKLEQEGYKIPWILGNEKAVKINKRFIDQDLNRVAPGNQKSSQYEPKRAFELVKKLSGYEFVLDIHGTKSKSGIFTIVTNPTLDNLLLAGCLPIDNIVIWSNKEKANGPLTKFVKRGIEIECGPKNSKSVKKQLREVLKTIAVNGINLESSDLESKKLFKVYGKLTTKTQTLLKDFQKATINGEIFYPLLVNQYQDITCYKMKKINLRKELSY